MSQLQGKEKSQQGHSVVGDPFFDPLSWSPTAGENSTENGHFNSANSQEHSGDGLDPLMNSDGGLQSSESSSWPWGHIFQPNERGRTEVACTEDMNSDQLGSSGSEVEDPSTVEQLFGPRSPTSSAHHNSASDLLHLIERSPLSSPNSTTEDEAVDDGCINTGMRHCQSDPDLLESGGEPCDNREEVASSRRRSGDVISMHRISKHSLPPTSTVLETFESFPKAKASSANSSYEYIPNLEVTLEGTPNAGFTVSDHHMHRHSLTPSSSPKMRKKKLSPRLTLKNSSPSRKKWFRSNESKPKSSLKPDKILSKGKFLDKALSSSKLHTVSASQNNIIAEHLRKNKRAFCDKKEFRFFLGTWNVNGKAPEGTLAPYLACYKRSKLEEKRRLLDDEDDDEWKSLQQSPHVFALGFQELDLSAEALVVKDLARETEWIDSITAALKEVGKYKRIHSVRLVGMLLVVFVEQSVARFVTEVDSDEIATGIMGIMGNKGGVALRMKIHETTVCFVNSHLPAHMEEVERRNDNFKQIHLKLFPDYRGLDGHEVVFWLGDLNYRIQTSDTFNAETIKQWANLYQLQELTSKDQLCNQRKQKKVFEDFQEGELTFKPTYKYDPGTDNWDTSEKSRAPAWCDRVLWRTQAEDDVALLDYTSHPKMIISDHKPVSALFNVKLMIPDKERRTVVLEEAFRKVDKAQNEILPQVTLETQEANFGDVYYSECTVVQIRVQNTGQVPVQVSFQKKIPTDDDYCPPWLTIRPSQATIWPEDYCKLTFVADINTNTAEEIVKGIKKMEDIVVLHLDDGKDYFITISGNYKLSFFGTSLHVLRYVALKGGIRGLPRAELAKLYKPDSVAMKSGSGAPLELWKLCDHLFKFGLETENLFIDEGMDKEVKQIREFLDSGGALTDDPIPGSIHSVAEVFVLYLESLAEPVVPYELHSKCMEAAHSSQLCREILHQMPEIHRNCFVYILMFLKEIIKHSSHNNSNPKFIATVFGNVLLRQDPSGPSAKSKKKRNDIDKKKSGFILQFLLENIL
jgi:phosphatidylinositol-bisphosphatase